MERKRVVIIGAAGRDFHNFNMYFKNNKQYDVVAFTAAQIPNIDGRKYPPELAGSLYPRGIPIYPEKNLVKLIKEKNVDIAVFSYSDVSHEHVMHICSISNAAGADFMLLGSNSTSIKSKKPVISICAVRTGCGKSQTSRKICKLLQKMGKKVVVVRHPMPYGNLLKQRVQRFASFNDLQKNKCTIEEMEEFEPYIEREMVVYAGVDYKTILEHAEKEADIILWDGGNNDIPFFKSDLHIVVVDPLRPGHELLYYPGETNARMADVIIINKVDSAKKDDINKVVENIKQMNSKTIIIEAHSSVSVDDPDAIKGKDVLVVEDGPTLTHGGMGFGAGIVAAKKYSSRKIIDPRQYAAGSIKEVYKKYKHLNNVLPAMGYGKKQIKDLEDTINKAECDSVVIGTPIDLRRVLKLNKPSARVKYELDEINGSLENVLKSFLRKMQSR